jgi:hypothetical protein
MVYRRRTLDYETFSTLLKDMSENLKINQKILELQLTSCGMPGLQREKPCKKSVQVVAENCPEAGDGPPQELLQEPHQEPQQEIHCEPPQELQIEPQQEKAEHTGENEEVCEQT